MIATGVQFERARLENDSLSRPHQGSAGWVFRMEPPLDTLGVFETKERRDKAGEGVRYAVRQVLDAEWRREVRKREGDARGKRGGMVEVEMAPEGDAADDAIGDGKDALRPKVVKRDFFGRIIGSSELDAGLTDPGAKEVNDHNGGTEHSTEVWCSFHEGFSNAVRKPITLKELMSGL